MATTYELINKVTLVSDQANVEFTSIPSTYTDLVVSVSARLARATNGGSMWINFNGSGSNFSNKELRGDGSSATGETGSVIVALIPGGNTTANVFSNFQVYIPNYASSNNKSFSADYASENNATTAYVGLMANLWSQTTAINAIKFVDGGAGDIVTGSTFYLYGIKNS
jgi:hypothetical protein